MDWVKTRKLWSASLIILIGLDLLVNISGPAELMKQIQQPHGEVKKRSSEVQASREEFGDVSETEKLVGQRGIQPESELNKNTSNESEGNSKSLCFCFP